MARSLTSSVDGACSDTGRSQRARRLPAAAGSCSFWGIIGRWSRILSRVNDGVFRWVPRVRSRPVEGGSQLHETIVTLHNRVMSENVMRDLLLF